jgi:hypothetical protein
MVSNGIVQLAPYRETFSCSAVADLLSTAYKASMGLRLAPLFERLFRLNDDVKVRSMKVHHTYCNRNLICRNLYAWPPNER